MKQLVILNKTEATPAVLRALNAIPEGVHVIITDMSAENLEIRVKIGSIVKKQVSRNGDEEIVEGLIKDIKE